MRVWLFGPARMNTLVDVADSHLDKVPGSKAPEAEDHTRYASHSVWENRPSCV